MTDIELYQAAMRWMVLSRTVELTRKTIEESAPDKTSDRYIKLDKSAAFVEKLLAKVDTECKKDDVLTEKLDDAEEDDYR